MISAVTGVVAILTALVALSSQALELLVALVVAAQWHPTPIAPTIREIFRAVIAMIAILTALAALAAQEEETRSVAAPRHAAAAAKPTQDDFNFYGVVGAVIAYLAATQFLAAASPHNAAAVATPMQKLLPSAVLAVVAILTALAALVYQPLVALAGAAPRHATAVATTIQKLEILAVSAAVAAIIYTFTIIGALLVMIAEVAIREYQEYRKRDQQLLEDKRATTQAKNELAVAKLFLTRALFPPILTRGGTTLTRRATTLI